MDTSEAPVLPHDVLGSHDILRHGLPSLKNDSQPLHPVQVIERTQRKNDFEIRRVILERTYGSALPLKMDIERQILSRFQRPGLPSSMLGLESSTGALDELGFDVALNGPYDFDSTVPRDLHHSMEIQLGLSKGPAARVFF